MCSLVARLGCDKALNWQKQYYFVILCQLEIVKLPYTYLSILSRCEACKIPFSVSFYYISCTYIVYN